MTAEVADLSGLTFAISPFGEFEAQVGNVPIYRPAALAPTIRAAGGTVIRVSTSGSAALDSDMYCLSGFSEKMTLEIAAARADAALPVRFVETKPLRDCDEADLDNVPYVLADSTDNGGRGKVLVEHSWQTNRIRSFVHSETPAAVGGLEIREYIPTPSDFYTSYRVLTTAVGDILAAGLLYSNHTKNSRPVSGEASAAFHTPGFVLPYSPYFLNATDIRSNLRQGGSCIPLAGPGRATITKQQRKVLEAHDIAPESPEIPDDLRQAATTLGQTVGRAAGLVCGLDFVQHRGTGEIHFLEGNIDPGIVTYQTCYPESTQLKPDQQKLALMHQSLRSIAKRHRSSH